MKSIKIILSLFITISLLSCGDNETEKVSFNLSKDNIIGSYNISALNLDTEVSNEIVSDVFATFSTAEFVGDTFQIDLTLNSDNTYTLGGQYRVLTTVEIVGGTNPTIPPTIINFTDAGTYAINTSENTINFTSQENNFLGNTFLDPVFLGASFTVSAFNEDTFTINQEAENVVDKIKTKTVSTISFVRK